MHETLRSVLKDLSHAYYEASTFGQFADVALALVARDYPGGAKILCAPGHLEEEHGAATIWLLGNKEILTSATSKLAFAGEPVLKMDIFIPKLHDLWTTWIEQDSKSHRHEYCEVLLDDFFLRLAASPQILGGYFMGGSRQFIGPRKLSAFFKKQKKEIVTLAPNYHLAAPAGR